MTKYLRKIQVGHWIGHVLVMILCLSCLLPFLLLISASFTEENTLIRTGYAFIPKVFSLESYEYLGFNRLYMLMELQYLLQRLERQSVLLLHR